MKEYNIPIILDDNQDALLNQITDIYNQCMNSDNTPETTLKFVLMMCTNEIDRNMEFLKTNFSYQLEKKIIFQKENFTAESTFQNEP